MSIEIGVIGMGYVGLTTALTFTSLGHIVHCYDNDTEKMARLARGEIMFFERGMEDALSSALTNSLLKVESGLAGGMLLSDIFFICVGSPPNEDGTVDISYVERAVSDLSIVLADVDDFRVVVVKSTVPPKTTVDVLGPLLSGISGKRIGVDVSICMCPEFFREGTSLMDSLHPDRLIFGTSDERSLSLLKKLYFPIDAPRFYTDPTTAEMIKYGSNSFLATKISFANEMANLCEVMGVDVDEVFEGISADARISPFFFTAGAGFGGSCFPKDVRGMVETASKKGVSMKLLRAVLEVNDVQYLRIFEKLTSLGELEGKKVAVLGLSFKSGTDDIRGSRSTLVVAELLGRGAMVSVYDKRALNNFRKIVFAGQVEYAITIVQALKNASVAIFMTDAEEFYLLTGSDILTLMAEPVVVDTRRIFAPGDLDGIEYHAIGRPRGP